MKLVGFAVLSALVILFNACSSENTSVSQTKSEVPKTKSLAVPPQIKIVETPRFKELKKQFETAETKVKRLEEQRIRLLTVYTKEHSKVRKVSQELGKAQENLKAVENLLNAEREKIVFQVKNPPV